MVVAVEATADVALHTADAVEVEATVLLEAAAAATGVDTALERLDIAHTSSKLVGYAQDETESASYGQASTTCRCCSSGVRTRWTGCQISMARYLGKSGSNGWFRDTRLELGMYDIGKQKHHQALPVWCECFGVFSIWRGMILRTDIVTKWFWGVKF